MKKIPGGRTWVGNQDFGHFLKVASVVFLDIAQDFSLGQCLKHLVELTPSKKNCDPRWGRNLSSLF